MNHMTNEVTIVRKHAVNIHTHTSRKKQKPKVKLKPTALVWL